MPAKKAAKKAAKKIAVPIKLERWFNDIKSVTHLQELIDDPVFQQAVAILKEASGPTVTSLDSDPQANSHKLAWYAGYRDAFNDLEKLTHRPSTTKTNQPDEWTHL
mgnify:FL=1|jgi:hypothetical protein